MTQRKPLVKIRKEQNHYLVYFIELRKIVPVNYVGAEIIRDFFDNQKSIGAIYESLKKFNNKLAKEDIEIFLHNLKLILETSKEGGYPVVEQEEMEVPLAVELQINTVCNLRCKHCCQANYTNTMSFEQVEFILDALYKAGVFEITLVGGELFLHPNVEEIIKLCCGKYSFGTTVVTNGTLLEPSLIKGLLRFRNTLSFLVSLEGVGEVNDKIRGKGVFQKVDKTLRLLKKEGFYVEISTTINNFNIEHYQRLIDYSKFLGVPLNFNLFKPFKDAHKNLILPPKKYFKFVKDIFEKRLSEKLDIGLTNAAITAELLNYPERNECRATLSGLTVDAQGRMVPCPFLSEIRYYDEAKLPRFNKDFLKIWRTDKYFNKFRKGNLKECQACSYIFKGNTKENNPYGVSAMKRYLKTQASY
ncbi:MAG: radical SAM protein [Candidatus Pacebacteria bacterium]|nr:radical SAM protein [Candidatus Paceibacterota bacterium]